MTSPRQWWRRAAAAVKDKRSLCLTMVSGPRGGLRNPDMEAAVIRATSHDDRSVDYKNAGRVFAWARTSPSFLAPLMWALARRADRTRSWPVALKSLLLAHGLLLLSSSFNGRLPFDLSDFRDRSSSNSWGFSAFVRAYFHFLDHRSPLLSMNTADEEDDCGLDRVEKLQTLLDLLMQIRPYADGMEVGLILEAMDCVVIEIFEVYSGICNGIASFLVGVLGSNSYLKSKGKEGEEERRRKGLKGIRVLRNAAEQSSQLSNYFEVCRSLGVLNATEFPPVERIPEEDIKDLERLVMGGTAGNEENLEEGNEENLEEGNEENLEERNKEGEGGVGEEEEEKGLIRRSGTVVTKDWVVFEDEFGAAQQGYYRNPFLYSAGDRPWASSWASMVYSKGGAASWNGNLIELM